MCTKSDMADIKWIRHIMEKNYKRNSLYSLCNFNYISTSATPTPHPPFSLPLSLLYLSILNHILPPGVMPYGCFYTITLGPLAHLYCTRSLPRSLTELKRLISCQIAVNRLGSGPKDTPCACQNAHYLPCISCDLKVTPFNNLV